jgi:ATP-dependent DNA helicase RecQ
MHSEPGRQAVNNQSITEVKRLSEILHDTFKIKHLRPGQLEVIQSVLQRKNTLAIMPTGAGKSLCYQLPALKMPGTTIVVSPLISLMKDQTYKLEEAGVEAAQINSTLTNREENDVLNSIANAEHEFVFTTPERLTDPDFIETIRSNHIDLFVIDEAHCISQWGHDFRPAYLNLSAAIAALGHPPVLALTATAVDSVIDDIKKQLSLPDMRVINTGIYRSNLHYQVIQVTSEEEKKEKLLQAVHAATGSGIVYVATVKAAEDLYCALADAGESVALYHGQLSAKQRKQNQDEFMQGQIRIMVATNAFGMGIDKQDIRFVIHFQIPANLEAYYQESGRAGRDGDVADCLLFYHLADKRIQQFFLARHYPSVDEIREIYNALLQLSKVETHIPFTSLRDALPNISVNKLQVVLKQLKDSSLISQDEQLSYVIRNPNAKPKMLAQLAEEYRLKNEHDRQSLEEIVFYAQTGFCRWKVILEYFGEKVEWEHCGTCDNCLHPPEKALSHLHEVYHPPQSASASILEKKEPTLSEGSFAHVSKFGEGRIVSITGDKVTMVFPNRQKKTFLRNYVKMS